MVFLLANSGVLLRVSEKNTPNATFRIPGHGFASLRPLSSSLRCPLLFQRSVVSVRAGKKLNKSNQHQRLKHTNNTNQPPYLCVNAANTPPPRFCRPFILPKKCGTSSKVDNCIRLHSIALQSIVNHCSCACAHRGSSTIGAGFMFS